MATTLFFYDLETSGFNPREARIMQFAGQRTDLKLNLVGDPVNQLIRLSDDVLPDPDAILTTGITPQQTLESGVTEASFIRLFNESVAISGTVFVGYNNIRFDDEFMRFLLYRNFYDAYEWQWKSERSKWDMLDVVRMTRALRPSGIRWPVDLENRPTNRLGLVAKINNLPHAKVHDALSDVLATIEIAKLIRSKQPKLFDYLLSLRNKAEVASLVEQGRPFIYTSGKYPSEFEKTTVVMTLLKHPTDQAALVYDLRHDPSPFIRLSISELVEAWQRYGEENELKLPIKTLKYNRCPAIAPLSVLDDEASKRIAISQPAVRKNVQILEENPEFKTKVRTALIKMDAKRDAIEKHRSGQNVDARLYEGFFSSPDKTAMNTLLKMKPSDLISNSITFRDERLNQLLPLYIARNYPDHLTATQRRSWDKYKLSVLMKGESESRLSRFDRRIQQLYQSGFLSKSKQKLVDDLLAWRKAIVPS